MKIGETPRALPGSLPLSKRVIKGLKNALRAHCKPWSKSGSLVVMATNLFSVSFVLEPKGYATPLLYLPLVCFWKSGHKLKEQEQRKWIKCDISDSLLSIWSPMKTKSLKEDYLFFISYTVISHHFWNI